MKSKWFRAAAESLLATRGQMARAQVTPATVSGVITRTTTTTGREVQFAWKFSF